MSNLFAGRSENFQVFVAAGAPFNQVWRLVAGLTLIAALWLLPLIAIVISTSLAAGPEGLATAGRPGMLAAPGTTLLFIAGFCFAYPAIWLTLRLLHGRGITSLLGPRNRLDWRSFQTAALVILAYATAGFFLSQASGTALPNLALRRWLLLLPLAIPLVFIQSAAEELIFRGYVIQQLGSRFASRWVWWVLPAAIFGALHWNPGQFLENWPLVVLAAFLMGLIAGDVTARTGNLGASLGLHFANNAYGILVLGLPGPLSGAALYISDVDMTDIASVRAGLIFQIIMISAIYLAYLAIASRRRS